MARRYICYLMCDNFSVDINTQRLPAARLRGSLLITDASGYSSILLLRFETDWARPLNDTIN